MLAEELPREHYLFENTPDLIRFPSCCNEAMRAIGQEVCDPFEGTVPYWWCSRCRSVVSPFTNPSTYTVWKSAYIGRK